MSTTTITDTVRYIPEGERATADVRNMIQVNEAMLTDSMVPLDKVMVRAPLSPCQFYPVLTMAF